MIVVTGDATVLGAAAGTSSLSELACDATNLTTVSFLFQSASTADSYGPIMKGNLTAAALGLAAQVPPTTSATDCMCLAASACTGSPDQACTMGGPGTAVDAGHACPGAPASDDEGALFIEAYGARPPPGGF